MYIAFMLSSTMRPRPTSTLFPYTTLFRSRPNVTVGGAHDVRPLLRRAAVGSALQPTDLLEIGSTARAAAVLRSRSEEHTSELQSGYISYAVFCLKKKKKTRR